MKRKGLGFGKGRGYYNIAPMDSHIHSLSAKGVKSQLCAGKYKMDAKGKKNTLNAKQYGLRIFNFPDEYSVSVWSENTSYGFRHIAVLFKNGIEQDRTKVSYYNRTWEKYQFQTVIDKLLNKNFDERDAKRRLDYIEEER